ncbi:YncE family protein [Streptomyces sp. BE303]|uniref:YncE family protein n=1 Tax=Streptomyces sp. BE303 TaxID=3002528 RepID=UPI002E780739|nr:YncE family protein [Streptomyces sp. BE303]MED7948109.1 YncE family protein [Streptomyces sp. BE303]
MLVFLSADGSRRLGEVPLPPEPHEILFDADRRLLYCTVTYRSGFYEHHGEQATELVLIDPDHWVVVETIDLAPECAPHGLALDAARALLYVSVEAGPAGDGAVLTVDLAARKVVERTGIGAPGPHWFALTPDGTKGYTTNKEAPFLTVVETASGPGGRGRTGRTVAVPGSEGIAMSADGRYAVVATPKLDLTGALAAPPALTVVDVRTDRVVRTLPLAAPAVPVHRTAGGLVLAGEVHLAAPAADGGPVPAAGRLRIFGAADGGHAGPEELVELGEVTVGQVPLTVHSSPDGRFGYVATIASDTVTVVDLTERRVVREVDLGRGAGPHGLAYVPAPR